MGGANCVVHCSWEVVHVELGGSEACLAEGSLFYMGGGGGVNFGSLVQTSKIYFALLHLK